MNIIPEGKGRFITIALICSFLVILLLHLFYSYNSQSTSCSGTIKGYWDQNGIYYNITDPIPENVTLDYKMNCKAVELDKNNPMYYCDWSFIDGRRCYYKYSLNWFIEGDEK